MAAKKESDKLKKIVPGPGKSTDKKETKTNDKKKIKTKAAKGNKTGDSKEVKKTDNKRKKKLILCHKKLNEQHKEYLRNHVAKYLTKKSTMGLIYMDIYRWPRSYEKSEAKRNQASIAANKIINTPGAKEYIAELQAKVVDAAELNDVIRPITEDLKILDKIIKHNAYGKETKLKSNGDTYEVNNIDKTSKAHTAIRAIETKARIMGEMRVRVINEDTKVDLSEEAMDMRLKALMGKATILPTTK